MKTLAIDLIAQKNAEIERLKANIIWLEARNKALTEMRVEDKALITKLCDAPGDCPRCGEPLVFPRGLPAYCEECGWPNEDFDQPAREATR